MPLFLSFILTCECICCYETPHWFLVLLGSFDDLPALHYHCDQLGFAQWANQLLLHPLLNEKLSKFDNLEPFNVLSRLEVVELWSPRFRTTGELQRFRGPIPGIQLGTSSTLATCLDISKRESLRILGRT